MPGVSAFLELAARAGSCRLVPASTTPYHRDLCPFVPRSCPSARHPRGQHAGRGDPSEAGGNSLDRDDAASARVSSAVGALGPVSCWLSCSTSWSGSGAPTSRATSRWTSRSSTHLPSNLPRDRPFAVSVARPGGPTSRATSRFGVPVRRAVIVVIAAKFARRVLADRPTADDRRLHRAARQVPRRGTCKCVRAGSPIPRQGRRGDSGAFGRGPGTSLAVAFAGPRGRAGARTGGREVSREGNLSMCARRICCSKVAPVARPAGLPRRPCGPSGRRRWLLSRRAGLPGELGPGQRPPSALRPRRGRQSDDTRPRTEPAARVTTCSPRSAFSVNGRSGAHTLAGFPPGNLLDIVFGIVLGFPVTPSDRRRSDHASAPRTHVRSRCALRGRRDRRCVR